MKYLKLIVILATVFASAYAKKRPAPKPTFNQIDGYGAFVYTTLGN